MKGKYEMMNMFKDPIWEMMDLLSNPFERKLSDNGLRSVLRRPHNLVNIKDENGKIVQQRLEIVTTPFKKEDVQVKVTADTLFIKCGGENIKAGENEEYAYRGISQQSYQVSLSLTPGVDWRNIKAENKDGILKITIPLVTEDQKNPEEIDVAID